MKINLAVIFGGKSVEHEISIISAIQAITNMNTEKYNIIPVYITKSGEFFTGDYLKDIEAFRDIPMTLKKCRKVTFVVNEGKTFLSEISSKLFAGKYNQEIDVAFPIVHGTNVEDGALQGYLQSVGLPYVGCDVLSSAVGMNKYVMKILLKEAGFPVLDCCRFRLKETEKLIDCIHKIENKIGYPNIVKPENLGSSVGISKAENRKELEEALTTAFDFADTVIVEKAVQNLKEINCSVLGDVNEAQASVLEEPVQSDKILSYKDKYVSGDKSGGSKGMATLKRKIPAEIPDETAEQVKKIAVDAFCHLGCNGVSRIDFLMDTKTGEFWLNEINTIPGSLSFYLWEPTGMKYTELLDRLVSLALKRHRTNERINYSYDTNILSQCGSFGSKGSKM